MSKSAAGSTTAGSLVTNTRAWTCGSFCVYSHLPPGAILALGVDSAFLVHYGFFAGEGAVIERVLDLDPLFLLIPGIFLKTIVRSRVEGRGYRDLHVPAAHRVCHPAWSSRCMQAASLSGRQAQQETSCRGTSWRRQWRTSASLTASSRPWQTTTKGVLRPAVAARKCTQAPCREREVLRRERKRHRQGRRDSTNTTANSLLSAFAPSLSCTPGLLCNSFEGTPRDLTAFKVPGTECVSECCGVRVRLPRGALCDESVSRRSLAKGS